MQGPCRRKLRLTEASESAASYVKEPETALDTQKLQLQTSSPHKATFSVSAFAASLVSGEGDEMRYIDRLMGATSLRASVFVGCCRRCDSDGGIDNNCRVVNSEHCQNCFRDVEERRGDVLYGVVVMFQGRISVDRACQIIFVALIASTDGPCATEATGQHRKEGTTGWDSTAPYVQRVRRCKCSPTRPVPSAAITLKMPHVVPALGLDNFQGLHLSSLIPSFSFYPVTFDRSTGTPNQLEPNFES